MTIQEQLQKARAAFDAIQDYTQEQVDKLCYEAAKAIYKEAVPLAEMAVAETRLGNVTDKIGKNTDTAAVFWDYLKDKKSVGIINEIPELGLYEVAHPIGVIACITPATNPTVTPLGNFMHAIKGKNAVIISPAPRAEKTSTTTVNLIRAALEKCGAPADLIQIVPDVTIEKSAELMKEADLVIATGSSGLTKAAYSSGTPAYGVGAGNPPVILDKGYDLKSAAEDTVIAVGSDNGILCDGDNLLLHPEETKEEFYQALRDAGVVVFDNPEDVDKFRKVLFLENGKSNPGLVGADAQVIANEAGFTLPDDCKIFALVTPDVGGDDVLHHEIMGPVVILVTYDTFEDAVDMAIKNMEDGGGIGHSAGIFSNDEEHIRYAGEKIPVARLLVNQPSPNAWGPKENGLSPAVSEGCGSWGNNILAGNVDYIHMINVSKVAKLLDVEPVDAEALFAD